VPGRARLALRYADLTRVTVRAIAVWDSPPPSGEAVWIPDAEVEAAVRERLERALGEHPAGPDREVRGLVERGDPATVLLDHARGAEALVLGNSGRGALAGAIVGSVAQRCVHSAQYPVVLVRTP
jgi:nucleotide-binding universal stress UspA family protein